jgi:short-subunit dehydrogenase involved in D-alanine esterification of teichoic acids
VAQAVMKGMAEDRFEIVVGMATNLVSDSRAKFEQIFQSMNARG